MTLRARVGLFTAAVVLACGGDDGPADGTEGSVTDDPSTAATTSAESTTSPSPDDTTDPDASSGGTPGGTPGCGKDSSPGDTVVETMVGATAREYLLVVPDGYDATTPLPLVFAWHGRGGTFDLARLYFQVEESSDGQAIFVYPQGLPLASMDGLTGWDVAPSGYDVDFFDTMLAEVSNDFCIDPERVFTTGHSFGGYMSNALGCFRASTLRAIGSVAGGPPFGVCEDDEVAAWITHGTLDAVVPLSQGESSRDALLERNGCSSTATATDPSPCIRYDDCADGLPVVWCPHDETNLQGHMWPRFAGPAIWAFFAALPPEP